MRNQGRAYAHREGLNAALYAVACQDAQAGWGFGKLDFSNTSLADDANKAHPDAGARLDLVRLLDLVAASLGGGRHAADLNYCWKSEARCVRAVYS